MKHENIVNLIEVCKEEPRLNGKRTEFMKKMATFYLVFEFCERDLAGLLNNSSVKLSFAEIKQVAKQLLNALYFIHTQRILHRDIKAANILITKEGIIKIADFGLARRIMQGKEVRYTNRVVTLWYRPPEIL